MGRENTRIFVHVCARERERRREKENEREREKGREFKCPCILCVHICPRVCAVTYVNWYGTLCILCMLRYKIHGHLNWYGT